MDRRRAAGLLLALAACFATATAAPTASNHTALDLYDGAPDGCYYNFQRYGEGDRIMTNEPCLNCTCHNRMLMCYLRVCPFTKPIGQDCTIEKRADQCCPIVTCPDVPVDLLTSTTTSPAEYGPTGIGKLDKYGCSINGKYFSEGSKVPPTPNKPCEHCYCIRNMTTCVMQECTLHVDGCTPIYHKDVCCPVRYSCDHPEDEMPLLDDLSTTVRPTPGFLLTTTTISPVTQMSQDCVYDNRIFPDGALIKTEKACDHCYCMKGDIVCVVQECGTPMENEGKNCTALPPREGICCPDTYICEGDEPTTGTFETDDFTTHVNQEILTTLSPPRRTSSEGSGYRNEPDEIPYTKSPILEPEIEGSGEDVESKQPDEITTEKHIPELTDDNMYDVTLIPPTTTKSEEDTETDVTKEEDIVTTVEKATEPQKVLPITTTTYSTKDSEEPITEKPEDFGSGELPQDINLKPDEDISVSSVSPEIEQNKETTEEYIVTAGFTDKESFELPSTTNVPFSNEDKTFGHETDKIEPNELTTSIPTNLQDISVTTTPVIEEDKNIAVSTKSTHVSEEITTKGLELLSSQTTSRTPILEDGVKETTESVEQNIITSTSKNIEKDVDLETQRYPSSTNAPIIDEEFVTTEIQELPADRIKDTAHDEHQHPITSTPMLEEIEKDTTQFNEPDQVITSGVTRDDTFNILSTTISNIPVMEIEKDVTETVISEEYQTEEYQPGTTKIPIDDLQEQTTVRHEDTPSAPIDKNIEESSEQPASTIAISVQGEVERKPTTDSTITDTVFDSERHEPSTSPTSLILENEEATTEPDKGLNTIPSEGIEEVIPVSPDAPHPTTVEQQITTEADLSNKFSTEPEDAVSATISDESISKDKKPLFTTASVFDTENDSPTEAQISSELTTITEKTISTLIPDYIISTGSIPNVQDETEPTELSKVTEKIEETTSSKAISDMSTYVTSTSEIVTENPTVSTPVIDKDSTTVNQEDNEIFNEPRIPGEGDCLLNGVTYTNESVVPSSNKCQSGCKCISSIIKCDPIICSPPPEYMNNCETTYDTPYACCPTYICDHKTETIPPQSHSQMSGTEAPVIPVVQCHGDECEINNVQEHHGESTGACKSGNCVGTDDDSKEGPLSPEKIPAKPIVQKDECVGPECKKNICADEKCQVTPVLPCEGDNCEQQPDVIIPPHTQQCAYGEDCSVTTIPAKECIGENCAVSSTQSKDSDLPKLPEEECKGDHCRRKDQHIDECTTEDCKSTQINVVPPTEQSQDKNKDIIETTDKSEFETPKEQTDDSESSNLPETSDVVTKPSDVTENDSLVTVSGINELVTKFEPEKTTIHPMYQPESTSDNLITDKDESYSETPQTSMSTDSTPKDSEDILSTSDKEIQVTDKSITTERAIETEQVQEFEMTEKSTSIKMSDATERTDDFINEQEPTEPSSEHRPSDETSVPSKESTESVTIQAQEVTKPSFEVQDETNTDVGTERSTEQPKSQDDNSKPDILKHTETTTIPQETITEPSKISSTETYELTGTSEDLESTKVTDSIKDYEVTEDVTRRTEPTSVNVNELDYTKTATEPTQYDPAIVSATTEHIQSVTILESADTVTLPKETEHKDTPTEITEKTVTEPTKSFVTESIDDTKSSEGFVDQLTTQREETTERVLESVTPKVQTEVDSETKAPEESKDDSISINETGTTETHTSETKTPEHGYHYETTSKTVEESSSEPSKIYDTKDESVTELPVKLDVEHSTQSLDKGSSEDSVTEQQKIQTPDDVDQKETISESPDKSATEPTQVYPVEEQEDNKTPVETDQENITDNIIDDFVTESSTFPDVKPNIPIISEEDKTTIIGHDTEPLSYYTTESQDVSLLHEHSIETTVKSVGEIISDTPKTEEEKYASLEPVTEEPNVQFEISRATTTSPDSTKLEEITIESSTKSSGSPHKETDLAINDLETKPTESGTEPIIQEDINTTPSSIDYNIPITAATSGELDQKPIAESTQQSIEEVQPTVAPVSKPEEVSQQSEEVPATEKDVSHIADPDELRTTPSEIFDQTTSKSVEVSSQSPHSEDVKTEYPEFTSPQNTEKIDIAEQEMSTEEIPTVTEKQVIPVIPVEISTEKSTTVVGNVDSTKEADPSQTSSYTESLIQESSTEEIVSKYSSPEPTSEETETPKIYLDENTVAPEYHDSKKTEKPIDDLIQSLVTESYDKETKPSDLEKESQTQTPEQISSIEPDNNAISTGTTQKDDKPAVSTEYDKSVEEVIGTETPSHIDKIESDSTTEKQQLTDGISPVHEPSDEDKETKTTMSDQTPITGHTHRPVIDVTTEVIDVISITENKELTSSEKPSIQEESTEFSYTTKAVTDSIFDITKVPNIQTQTDKSETITMEFSETQPAIGETTVKPISEVHDFSSDDHKTTEILETTKTQSEVTTLKPGAETPFFVPTTMPKQEPSQATGGSFDKIDHTDKIEQDSTITPVTVELTTEHLSSEPYFEKEPESLPTEISVDQFATTRKQLDTEIYQTTSPTEVIQEISTSPSVTMVEHATTLTNELEQKPQTEKPSIPVVIQETEKLSTPEESVTAPTEKIVHASDKPIQETTAPEEEFIVATPKATTTKPEEETSTLYPAFDRTSKPSDVSVESFTTTVSELSIPLTSEVPLNTVFGNIATSSEDFITSTPESIVTKTPEISDITEVETFVTKMPIAVEPEVTITSASEPPSVTSETQTTSIPIASEEVLTDTPIELSTRLPEIVTISNDVSSTSVPEIPESPTTLVSKEPISNVPEEPVTNIPIGQEGSIVVSSEETTTSVPEILQPVTSASVLPEKSSESISKTPSTEIPEVPVTSISDAPATSVTNVPEALITNEPELDVTKSPELPISKIPEEPITSVPEVDMTKLPQVQISSTPEEPITSAPELDISKLPEVLISGIPEEPSTSAPEIDITKSPELPVSSVPEEPITSAPEFDITKSPEEPIPSKPKEPITTSAPEIDVTESPEMPTSVAAEEPITRETEIEITKTPKVPISSIPEEPITSAPEVDITKSSDERISSVPEEPLSSVPEEPITSVPKESISSIPEEPITSAPGTDITKSQEPPSVPEEATTIAPEVDVTKLLEEPASSISDAPITSVPEESITSSPDVDITKSTVSATASVPDEPISSVPAEPITSGPEVGITKPPELPVSSAPEEQELISKTPEEITTEPEVDITKTSESPVSSAPKEPISRLPEEPITNAPEIDITKTPQVPTTGVPETPIASAPEAPITNAPEIPATAAPELPKPVSTEAQPTEEALTPDEEGSFPPSGGTSGYGQEPDYVEEDQTFGPGTCRYGGKVYVSAQQIPRDDPCDFCFCFRSDIICLQQSCPPPIHGCHEEPIQGFCCPRYECPVSMATTVNVTTTTTTTTTTLPPHFPTHSYKGSVQKRGCQIKGQTYKVGEVVRASSGPCLHCTCGGDGQMKCDPKVCTPEPMLRQMIAAAVSAKRRR